MTSKSLPRLTQVDSPEDLRRLEESALPALATELRTFLVESVSRTGGHLAASLGTVELTIALHYVLNTPEDRLVWDVGHQSYGHKVLTGRREAMAAIRREGGLCGFPQRDESAYDAFGVGHSSTSISAALGMALAAEQTHSQRRAVAVIGDGAMTAGMAFEALNHAGALKTDLLVILNDNDMSISPNVGALSNYLTRVLSSRPYSSVREGGKTLLEHLPGHLSRFARRAEEHVKGMVTPGTLFEEMGFHYFGPVDGHDLSTLIPTLRNLEKLHGPRLLHVVTRKGKGYPPAEENPVDYHGVTRFDPGTGAKSSSPPKGPSYSDVFGQWLCDMADRDPQLVAVTPAMIEGSGMVEFQRQFPSRCFDVGIAEQHAVTLCAGMACDGLHPVMAIYSTFLQRAYDQLIHDVALQKLPVLFAIDRAGLVGADGPTHAGAFDLSYLRCIPEMVIMTPADERECRQMLSTGHKLAGPAAVRYPRGSGPGRPPGKDLEPLPVGRGEIRRQGRHIALLNFGSLLGPALEAGEALDATVANLRFVKPLDEALIRQLAADHELLITLEENAIAGGAGSGVAEFLTAQAITTPTRHLGLPDRFIPHGNHQDQLTACGLDADGIRSQAEQWVQGLTGNER